MMDSKGPVPLGPHLRITQMARKDFVYPKILGHRAQLPVTAYVTTHHVRITCPSPHANGSQVGQVRSLLILLITFKRKITL